MTQIVNPSQARAASSYKTAGAISQGGATDGFVVDGASPTKLAVDDANLDETVLSAFSESHSATSYDVTIDPGEAFVYGSWAAKDTSTTVTLPSNTAGVSVYVGWDRTTADSLIIGRDTAFASADPKIEVWQFDTDGSGVAASYDQRRIGKQVDAEDVNATNVQSEEVHGDNGVLQGQTLESGESLTVPADESMVVGGEYDVQGDLNVQGRMDIVSGTPDHASVQNAEPDDHLSLLASEVVTISGGQQPAYDGWLTNVVEDQYQKFDVVVSVESGLSQTYAYNETISKRWNDGSWDIGLTVNWDNDPGSDIELRIDVHER